MADFKREGNIDMMQWKNFRNMFLLKFEKFDTNTDLYLDADELKEYSFLFRSLKDVGGVLEFLNEENLWS